MKGVSNVMKYKRFEREVFYIYGVLYIDEVVFYTYRVYFEYCRYMCVYNVI